LKGPLTPFGKKRCIFFIPAGPFSTKTIISFPFINQPDFSCKATRPGAPAFWIWPEGGSKNDIISRAGFFSAWCTAWIVRWPVSFFLPKPPRPPPGSAPRSVIVGSGKAIWPWWKGAWPLRRARCPIASNMKKEEGAQKNRHKQACGKHAFHSGFWKQPGIGPCSGSIWKRAANIRSGFNWPGSGTPLQGMFDTALRRLCFSAGSPFFRRRSPFSTPRDRKKSSFPLRFRKDGRGPAGPEMPPHLYGAGRIFPRHYSLPLTRRRIRRREYPVSEMKARRVWSLSALKGGAPRREKRPFYRGFPGDRRRQLGRGPVSGRRRLLEKTLLDILRGSFLHHRSSQLYEICLCGTRCPKGRRSPTRKVPVLTSLSLTWPTAGPLPGSNALRLTLF